MRLNDKLPPNHSGFSTPAEFIAYLEDTLIPDLRDSGSEETATDFETAVAVMRSACEPEVAAPVAVPYSVVPLVLYASAEWEHAVEIMRRALDATFEADAFLLVAEDLEDGVVMVGGQHEPSARILAVCPPLIPVSKWENHEDFPVEDWMADVAAGDTRLSYSDWVDHNLQ